MKRRTHIIRRESLISRIQSYPFDFFLWANEIISSTPWDDYADSLGVTGGYTLSTLYTLMLRITSYYRSANKKRANPLFQTNLYDYERFRGSSSTSIQLSYYSEVFLYILNVLTIAMFVVSSINAIYLVTSHRNYTLFYSNIENQPKSSSARKITLTNDPQSSTWDRIMQMLYLRSSSSTMSYSEDDTSYDISGSFDETTIDEINLIEKEIWELSVWTPSKFRLTLGATFSPLLLSIIFLVIDDISIWKLLTIGASINLVLFSMSKKFLCLVQDKQILYQEMFEEFNNKVVKPKTNILKKDVCIDATYGPGAPLVLTVKTDQKSHLGLSKLKVFITHDINGKAFNNLSIAQRRKVSPRGDTTITTESAALGEPLANSSFFQEAHSGPGQSPTGPYNTSRILPQLRYQHPLESPFKSPDKRDHLYYGQNTTSTPYSRRNQSQPQSQPHSQPHSQYQQYNRRDLNSTTGYNDLGYDRSYQSARTISPNRIPVSRGREFQSPKPRQPPMPLLRTTPLAARNGNISQSYSRSPSPTKKGWRG